MSQRDREIHRLYGHRWRKARRHFLDQHPLCKRCEDGGALTAAIVVHHTIPHRGDPVVFWDVEHWEPMCKQCHDSIGQVEDKGGEAPKYKPGVDINGVPLDPRHPFRIAHES